MARKIDIERAITVSYPETERPRALEAINKYRSPERDRVRLAILVLANGDIKELESLVNAAAEDYRDILFWAEYPEDSGTGTREEMAGRYRALGVPVPEDLE